MRATIYIDNISPKIYQGDYEVFISSITPQPHDKLTIAQRIQQQQQEQQEKQKQKQQHATRKHGRSKPSVIDHKEKPTEVYLRGKNLSFQEWSCTGEATFVEHAEMTCF